MKCNRLDPGSNQKSKMQMLSLAMKEILILPNLKQKLE
jgi:hypothetical protein